MPDGARRPARSFLVGVLDDANRAALISAIIGTGACFARRLTDGRRTGHSLAQVLVFELEENRKAVMRSRRRGIRWAECMMFDGVYRGLLASGNVRYLHDHQAAPHKLHSTTGAVGTELTDTPESAIAGVRRASRSPLLWWLSSLRGARGESRDQAPGAAGARGAGF